MLRFISCQQATLLVEQRADAPLPPADGQRLGLHLHYCPYCASYARQSSLMNELARAAAQRHARSTGLTAEAKQRFRQLLTAPRPAPEETKDK